MGLKDEIGAARLSFEPLEWEREEEEFRKTIEQLTWGYNIVADGWVGAYRLCISISFWTDGQTDGRTDGPTDQ